MIIYPESGTYHADYLDGSHTIHYVHAAVEPGSSVQFDTGIAPNRPAFRLTYSKVSDGTLSILFEMAMPGLTAFHTVAEGQIVRR